MLCQERLRCQQDTGTRYTHTCRHRLCEQDVNFPQLLTTRHLRERRTKDEGTSRWSLRALSCVMTTSTSVDRGLIEWLLERSEKIKRESEAPLSCSRYAKSSMATQTVLGRGWCMRDGLNCAPIVFHIASQSCRHPSGEREADGLRSLEYDISSSRLAIRRHLLLLPRHRRNKLRAPLQAAQPLQS